MHPIVHLDFLRKTPDIWEKTSLYWRVQVATTRLVFGSAMKTSFLSTSKRRELPAGFMLASILIAAFLVKTGLGWWGIAAMIAMCILDVVL